MADGTKRKDGDTCHHGKVFIESNLSMAPCPKCKPVVTDEMVERSMKIWIDGGFMLPTHEDMRDILVEITEKAG